jgi:hypothetical protein
MLQLSNGGTMKKHDYYKPVCAAVLFIGLVACASNTEEVMQRPLPSYASPFVTTQGLNTWTVRCPMQSVTGLDDRNTNMFYKRNGMTKSLLEFCDEFDATTRIQTDQEDDDQEDDDQED